jgi:hypothetical protein
MRPQQLIPLLGSAVLAAAIATVLLTIPTLAQIEEPWNIVVVSQVLALARTTFIVTVAHALVLGLPLFLFLLSIRHVGVVTCALGGFLVGAVPFGVLALTSMIGLQSASTDGKATVINGVPTLAGWIEYAQGVGFVGLFGIAGGLAFWIALRFSGHMAVTPNRPDTQSSKIHAGSWSIGSAAVVLTCAILVMPNVVRDNSCHNLFRDDRTSIGPQIHADMNLSAEDWSTLKQIFVNFGAANSLSFRGDEKIRHGNIVWRDLNLCSEAGINIDAVDQPWLARINSPLADRGIKFSVYELKPTSDWKPLAHDLLNRIEIAWPQKTTFRGANGKILSVEEALKGRQ